MKFSFNLVSREWIPCLTRDGTRKLVSLRDLFDQLNTIASLDANSPLTNAALLRLILAITYRATGYPDLKTSSGWLSVGFPASHVNEYLDRWSNRFDLFGPDYPFYQTGHLEIGGKPSLTGRLAIERASGNNPVQFDHSSDKWETPFSAQEAALMVVTTQAYSPSGGAGNKPTVKDLAIKPKYLEDSSIIKGLSVYVAGETLLKTVVYNLIESPANTNDQPPWELEQPLQQFVNTDTGARIEKECEGIVDQLTWQSRLLRILPEEDDGKVITKSMYFSQGKSAPPIDDPFKPYGITAKAKKYELGFQPEKAIWRDLHAILSHGKTFELGDKPKNNQDTYQRPQTLHHFTRLLNEILTEDTEYQLNLIGLAKVPGKAKFFFWRHETFPTPGKLFNEEYVAEYFQQCIDYAESTSRSLYMKFQQFYITYSGDSEDKDKIRKLSPGDIYWSALKTPFLQMLSSIATNLQQALQRWEKAVQIAAWKALETAINAFGQNARALRAKSMLNTYFKPFLKQQEDEDE